MTISYNLTGKARTALAKAISQNLNTEAAYIKGKTHAYIIGGYTLDKEGTLTGPDSMELVNALRNGGFAPETATYETADEPAFEELDMTLEEELGLGRQRREDPQGEYGMHESDVPEGFTYRVELSDPNYPDRMEIISATDDEDAIRQAYSFTSHEVVLLELHQFDEDFNEVRSVGLPANPHRLTIEVPLEGFTPEKLDNLFKMVTAKESLLKAALGAEALPIQVTGDTIRFPWFQNKDALTAEETEAYATFISLLCKTAKEKKRVNAKEKASESSPKFLMRVFLLSLGFIGDEYKTARRILLSKLSGSSAWLKGAPKKAETEATVE